MPNFERAAKFQSLIFFGPAILGAVFACLVPKFGVMGFLVILMSVLGAKMVITAKVNSKLRTREVMEWGPRKMLPVEKRSYILGYCLVAISIGMLILQRYKFNM